MPLVDLSTRIRPARAPARRGARRRSVAGAVQAQVLELFDAPHPAFAATSSPAACRRRPPKTWSRMRSWRCSATSAAAAPAQPAAAGWCRCAISLALKHRERQARRHRHEVAPRWRARGRRGRHHGGDPEAQLAAREEQRPAAWRSSTRCRSATGSVCRCAPKACAIARSPARWAFLLEASPSRSRRPSAGCPRAISS